MKYRFPQEYTYYTHKLIVIYNEISKSQKNNIFVVDVSNVICTEDEYIQNIVMRFYFSDLKKNIIFALEPKAYHAL